MVSGAAGEIMSLRSSCEASQPDKSSPSESASSAREVVTSARELPRPCAETGLSVAAVAAAAVAAVAVAAAAAVAAAVVAAAAVAAAVAAGPNRLAPRPGVLPR